MHPTPIIFCAGYMNVLGAAGVKQVKSSTSLCHSKPNNWFAVYQKELALLLIWEVELVIHVNSGFRIFNFLLIEY